MGRANHRSKVLRFLERIERVDALSSSILSIFLIPLRATAVAVEARIKTTVIDDCQQLHDKTVPDWATTAPLDLSR